MQADTSFSFFFFSWRNLVPDEDDSQGKLGKGVIAYQASNAELLNEVENKELQQKKLDKKKKKKGQMNFLWSACSCHICGS